MRRPNDIFNYDESGRLDKAGRHDRIVRANRQLQDARDANWPDDTLQRMRDRIIWPPSVSDDPASDGQ